MGLAFTWSQTHGRHTKRGVDATSRTWGRYSSLWEPFSSLDSFIKIHKSATQKRSDILKVPSSQITAVLTFKHKINIDNMNIIALIPD